MLILRIFAILACVSAGLIMPKVAAAQSAVQVEYVLDDITALEEKFSKATVENKLIAGKYEIPVPTIKNYFDSSLPAMESKLKLIKNKLLEKSHFIFPEGSPTEENFKKEVEKYVALYAAFYRLFIISAHNENNSLKNHMRYISRIESLRLKFHLNSFSLVKKAAANFLIEDAGDEYYHVVISQYQKASFEGEAMRNVKSLKGYAKAVQYFGILKMMYNHVNLQNYHDEFLPDETVNSCAADNFFSFQAPANGNMLESDFYLEAKRFESYETFYRSITDKLAKATADSYIFSPQLMKDYFAFMEGKFKGMKRYINSSIKKQKDDPNLGEALYKDYNEFKKFAIEDFPEAERNYWLTTGESTYDQALSPNEDINFQKVYETAFGIPYEQMNMKVMIWVRDHFYFEDNAKMAEEMFKQTMEFFKSREQYAQKNVYAKFEEIKVLQAFKTKRTMADYLRNEKIGSAVRHAKDALLEAKLIQDIQEKKIDIDYDFEEEQEFFNQLALIKTPALATGINFMDRKFYREEISECDLVSLKDSNELSEQDFNTVLSQSTFYDNGSECRVKNDPASIRTSEKILPSDPKDLNFLVTSKINMPAFGGLFTTTKYDERAQALMDYFNKRILDRFNEESKAYIEYHELDPMNSEEFHEKYHKGVRQQILWKVAVEEAKKIRIGFVRRKICEHINIKKDEIATKVKDQTCTDEDLAEDKHYSDLHTYYKCYDKKEIQDNYMSNHEITELAQTLKFENDAQMIKSFLFDPFAKIREKIERNGMFEGIDLSNLEVPKEFDPSQGRYNPETGRYEPIKIPVFGTGSEQRVVEIAGIDRKGFWTELGGVFTNPMAVDWQNLWDKALFRDDSYENDEKFHFEQKGVANKLDIHQDLFARELFAVMSEDMSYLMGEDKYYIYKDENDKTVDKPNENELEQELEEINNVDVVVTEADTTNVQISSDKELEDLLDNAAVDMDTIQAEIITNEEALLLMNPGSGEVEEVDLYDLDGLDDLFGAEVPLEQPDSTAVILPGGELKEVAVDTVATDTTAAQTLVVKKEYMENPQDSLIQKLEVVEKKVEEKKQRLKSFEELIAESAEQLTAEQIAQKRAEDKVQREKKKKKKVEISYQKYSGDYDVFKSENRDYLELLKTDTTSINGVNYLIKQYVKRHWFVKEHILENLGKVFDQMLKLYGLFEVVELGMDENRFDFSPTMYEQYIVASHRTQQAQERARILALEDTYIEKVTKRRMKYGYAPGLAPSAMPSEDYIDEEEKQAPLLFTLSKLYVPGDLKENDRRVRDKIARFIDEAIINVKGKLASYCEADYTEYDSDKDYKNLFRSAGAIRRSLFTSENTLLDSVARGEIEKEYEEKMIKKTRSRREKIVHSMDIVGMVLAAVFMIAMFVAMSAGTGGAAAATAPAWIAGLQAFMGMSAGASMTAVLLSPGSLILFGYFLIPNSLRVVDVIHQPAQIRYQKSIMTTQIIEGLDITTAADYQKLKSDQTGRYIETGIVWVADFFFFFRPVAKGLSSYAGRRAAVILKNRYGMEFIGYFSKKRLPRGQLADGVMDYTKRRTRLQHYFIDTPRRVIDFTKNYKRFMESFAPKVTPKANQMRPYNKVYAMSSSIPSGKVVRLDKWLKFKQTVGIFTNAVKKGTGKISENSPEFFNRMFKAIRDEYEVIKLMRTKVGHVGLKQFLTGVPRSFTKKDIVGLWGQGMIDEFAKKPTKDLLKNHLKEIDYMIEIYSRMRKTNYIFKEGFSKKNLKNLSDSQAMKVFEEGAWTMFSGMKYARQSKYAQKTLEKAFVERMKFFLQNPAGSWNLYWKGVTTRVGYLTNLPTIYPSHLIKAIRRNGGRGIKDYMDRWGSYFLKSQEMGGMAAEQFVQQMKQYREIVQEQANQLLANPNIIRDVVNGSGTELVLKNSAAQYDNEMHLLLAGFKNEQHFLAMEDVVRLRMPIMKQYRKVFKDYKLLVDDFAPYAHIASPGQFAVNIDNLTPEEDFKYAREAAADMVNKKSKEADDHIYTMDEMIY
jgi:hypothetical protein